MDRQDGDQLSLPTPQVGVGSKTLPGGVAGLVSGPTPILLPVRAHTLTFARLCETKIKACKSGQGVNVRSKLMCYVL